MSEAYLSDPSCLSQTVNPVSVCLLCLTHPTGGITKPQVVRPFSYLVVDSGDVSVSYLAITDYRDGVAGTDTFQ